MSRMVSLPEHLQGQAHLHHSGDSDVSEASYQASRQSSLNTEPLTLDAEEIGTAKGEAKHVLESVGSQEAMNIFTKDLKVENGKAMTEREMANKMVPQVDDLLAEREPITEEELAKKTVDNHFDNLLQKTTLVVEANEKLAQATSKSSGTPKEESPGEE